MTEVQKRSFSQASSPSNNSSKAIFFIQPQTSPFADIMIKEGTNSPTIHQRRAIKPQLTTYLNNSFTSFSLNNKDSIHNLLPKQPQTVTNQSYQIQNDIQITDFLQGNQAKQTRQTKRLQNNKPAQLNETQTNTLTKIDSKELSQISNIRSSSPVISNHTLNLFKSLNNNTPNMSNHNFINRVVNIPKKQNMLQNIVVKNENEYLKNKHGVIKEQQIFANNDQKQESECQNIPIEINLYSRFEGSQQAYSNKNSNQITRQSHTRSPTSLQNQISLSPQITTTYFQQRGLINKAQFNEMISTPFQYINQEVKNTAINISDSVKTLLDNYKIQKETQFEQSSTQKAIQNYSIQSLNKQAKILNISQEKYKSRYISPLAQNLTTKSLLTNSIKTQIQNFKGNRRQQSSLKDIPPLTQTYDLVQSPIERQRCFSQKLFSFQTSTSTSASTSTQFQFSPSSIPPGSCALTKITSRMVTSIEEKNLIELYKIKNKQRKQSSTSLYKSQNQQLPIVEELFEQSVKLSNSLIHQSEEQTKNSINIYKNPYLQEDFSIQNQEQSDENEQYNSREQKNEQQINIYESFSEKKENQNQDIVDSICKKQNNRIYFDNSFSNSKFLNDSFQIKNDQINQHQIQSENVTLSQIENKLQNEEEEVRISNFQVKQDLDKFQGDTDNSSIQDQEKLQQIENKYRSVSTSPIKIIDAKSSTQVLNSVNTETDNLEQKSQVEFQLMNIEYSPIGIQQNNNKFQGHPKKQFEIYNEKVYETKEKQESIDENDMKKRQIEIHNFLKEKKKDHKRYGSQSNQSRENKRLRQQSANPIGKNNLNYNIFEQNVSSNTKKNKRNSMDISINMKQSGNSFEDQLLNSQSMASVQQLALQKRDEILDKIKHIDEQIILHQKQQSQQKDDLTSLRAQNKLIIPNNIQSVQVYQNKSHNRRSHSSTKSNPQIETPNKKIKIQRLSLISSSATNIKPSVSQQQYLTSMAEKKLIKRSESIQSFKKQSSNRKIEGFTIYGNENSSYMTQSFGATTATTIVSKNQSSSNSLNIGSNNFLNNFKESFVKKNIRDQENEKILAQKQQINKQNSCKKQYQYPNQINLHSSSCSVQNNKEMSLANTTIDKIIENKGLFQNSIKGNKHQSHINQQQSQKKYDENGQICLKQQKQNSNQCTKENIINHLNEALGVINLFELQKNKRREKNKNISKIDMKQQNYYLGSSDNIKDIEKKDITMNGKLINLQQKNIERNYATDEIDDAYTSVNYESKSSAKFNTVLQDVSNYYSEKKNTGISVFPTLLQSAQKDQNNVFIQNNQNGDSINNPYLLKQNYDPFKSQIENEKNLQMNYNKYHFSFDRNLEQGDEKIPSCSFTTKYNDAGFVDDCSPITQRNKIDEELSDLSAIQNHYYPDQQDRIISEQNN